MKKTFISLLLLFLHGLGFSQDLKNAKPESAGFSTSRLERIDDFLKQHIENQWLPGAVAMVSRNSTIVYAKSFGKSGIAGQDMKMDDVFRLASMTKPIVTTAMMILVEKGKCLLDDPVSKYIPEFNNATILKDVNARDSSYTTEKAKNYVTIRHLLTHTSGIGYSFTDTKKAGVVYGKAGIPDGANINNITAAEKMKILAALPLLHEPGEKWTYGLGIDMAGYLVEVLSGQSLSDFCEKEILQPLGMKDTHFFRDQKEENRVVHLYSDINGKVLDVMAYPQAKNIYFPTRGAKTYYSGGSGLSGTATDYMKFMQMILNGGQLNGIRILSRKSVEAMSHNQIDQLTTNSRGTKFGLGFSLETQESSYHKLGTPGRLGWGGLYNTTFWIDPKENIAVVLMTQIYPSTHQRELYDTFENLVYQALKD